MTFENAYQNYYRELFAFSCHWRLKQSDIEDLLQDVFLQLYKEMKKGSLEKMIIKDGYVYAMAVKKNVTGCPLRLVRFKMEN